MSWVRTGPCPDEIKISFVVKREKDPELAEWLWRLPYRKASEQVRDVLSVAAKQTASRAGDAPANGSTALPETPDQSGAGYPFLAGGELMHGSLGVKAVGVGSMAEEVANVMQDMDRQF